MTYAKLINNNLVLAPNPIIIGDRQIGNPPGEVYTEQGYKPVIFTDPPEVDPVHEAIPGWREINNEIVQIWLIIEVPISEEEALIRFSNELTGRQDQNLEEVTETLIKSVMEV